MSKDKGSDQHAPLTEAAREPKLPPSLNKVRGVSAVEEDDRRHRLEQIMHGLPLREGAAPQIPNFARDLYEMFLLATHATGARRKTRSASPNSVKRQLRDVERGANTL